VVIFVPSHFSAIAPVDPEVDPSCYPCDEAVPSIRLEEESPLVQQYPSVVLHPKPSRERPPDRYLRDADGSNPSGASMIRLFRRVESYIRPQFQACLQDWRKNISIVSGRQHGREREPRLPRKGVSSTCVSE